MHQIKYLITERRRGKTEYLVGWARESSNRVIIVNNYHEKRRLINDYKLSPSQVFSYSELHLLKGKPNWRDIEYGIDNLEEFLYYTFGISPISVITATGDLIEAVLPKEEQDSMPVGVKSYE